MSSGNHACTLHRFCPETLTELEYDQVVWITQRAISTIYFCMKFALYISEEQHWIVTGGCLLT